VGHPLRLLIVDDQHPDAELSARQIARGGYPCGGTLASNVAEPLDVFGRFTQLPAGTLELNIGNHGAGRLNVRGDVLVGGALHVKLKPGFEPVAGGVIHVIDCREGLRGRFGSIKVDGFRVTPVYTRNGLFLRIDG
jgi:hypothetical protein